MKQKPRPTVKGFACENCKGHRLHVIDTERPMAGLVVRYRECSACGYRIVTEERLSKTRNKKNRMHTA